MADMSVIVLTPDNYAMIKRLMTHLGAQSAPYRLEIVLVAPQISNLQAEEVELAGYALGAGTASERLVDLDFRRERFISQADRHMLAAERTAAGDSVRAP
jgi:hypothetical protein